MKIFIDMDGVITDFTKGVDERFGTNVSEIQQWKFDYQKLFGMSRTKFWKSLDVNFWKNLPKTPEADLILSFVEHLDPIILTSPPKSRETEAMEGKIEWIKKNLPDYYRENRYFFGYAKWYLAEPWSILIDDKQETIANWQVEGGTGILVPRPWNGYREKNTLQYVYEKLEALGVMN